MRKVTGEVVFPDFKFDCEISVAVNPVSYTEVSISPPVKIRCYHDFNRFNDQWERFCGDLASIGITNPETVYFELGR